MTAVLGGVDSAPRFGVAMEDEGIFFFHPIFGPWRLLGAEEDVAKLADELPYSNFFYAPTSTEYYTGLAAGAVMPTCSH